MTQLILNSHKERDGDTIQVLMKSVYFASPNDNGSIIYYYIIMIDLCDKTFLVKDVISIMMTHLDHSVL